MIIIGSLYYISQRNRIFREQANNLSSIASLKTEQILTWYSQRLSEAATIRDNEPLTMQIKHYFNDKKNSESKRVLIKWMESVNKESGYKGVSIADSTMKVRLADSPSDSITHKAVLQDLEQVIHNQRIIMTDLHKEGPLETPHFNLLVPLIDTESNVNKQFGALIFRIDPQDYLIPLINSWTTTSKSSEILFLSLAGDSIEYLNKFKDQENTSVNLHLPLTNRNLLEAEALKGKEGIYEGVDYKNISVIGYVKKTPGLPFYIIAKVDKEELQTPLRWFLIMAILVTVLLIMITGVILGYWIWSQKVRFYKQELSNELSRKALERHFEYLFKYANDIIILADSNLKIVEVNDSTLKAYGYSREEMSGMHVLNLRTLTSQKQFEERILILKDTGSDFYETIHLKKDGSEFPIELSARAIEIEGTKYYQWIGRNIFDRKLAEQVLKESEETYRSLVENIDFGVSLIDTNFKIVMSNAQIGKWFKKPLCNFVGKNCFNEFEKRNSICPHCPGIKAMATGLPQIAETEGILEDGSKLKVLVHAFPVFKEEGQIRGFIEVIEDITLRKRQEEELITAKNKAEESDRLKTAFLQNISHEIRTPLNAILGFSELIQDPDNSIEDSKFFIEQIHYGKEDLLELVENVFFASKFDTKQFVSTIRKFNLNESLNDLLADSKKLLIRNEKSHLSFLSHIESTNGYIIEADENNIMIALRQIISNAVKYTESGGIEFITKLIGNSEIEFTIKDSGIGIDKREQIKIFDRFYKVESNSNKLFRGAGIGLTIVKGIIESLGGTISLESSVGNGSVFYINIPVKVIGSGSTKKKTQNDMSVITNSWGMKSILIVEDVDTNFAYLDKALNNSGLTKFHAHNGREAIELIKTNNVDLILMDILMPVMDGYEATTIIRSQFPSIPIVAQTAIYNKTGRDADFASLFDDYLLKPITKNSLIEVLDKYLGPQT